MRSERTPPSLPSQRHSVTSIHLPPTIFLHEMSHCSLRETLKVHVGGGFVAYGARQSKVK